MRIRLLPIHYCRPTCAKQLSRTVAGGELSAQAGRENASTRGLFLLLGGVVGGEEVSLRHPSSATLPAAQQNTDYKVFSLFISRVGTQ